MKLHEYIMKEILEDVRFYTDEEEDHYYISFFPKLLRAYIEYNDEKHWIECYGVHDADDKFKEMLKNRIGYSRSNMEKLMKLCKVENEHVSK